MSTQRNYAHEVVTDVMHNEIPNLVTAQRARDQLEHLQEINADLLAALEQLNIWMTSGVKVDGKHPDIAHQWIKTAIARAKGQS